MKIILSRFHMHRTLPPLSPFILPSTTTFVYTSNFISHFVPKKGKARHKSILFYDLPAIEEESELFIFFIRMHNNKPKI